MQAQACNTLQGQNCTNYAYTLASGRTIQPCQRYGRGKRRCRVKPKLAAADRAAFAVAQKPPPPQGVLETAQRTAGGVLGGITGALGVVASAVSDTVLGATDAAGITQESGAAPLTDTDILSNSLYETSQLTGMSVDQARLLRADRLGHKPRPRRRKRKASKRRKASRRSRVSKRRKSVSKRRRRRSSRRRSSRRRSSRRRSSRR